MHWLLHTRRVPMEPWSAEASSSNASKLQCAGTGLKHQTAWCCMECIKHLCCEHPTLPPIALANDFWLGRQHPWYRNLSLGMCMLLSTARLIMKQLLLGRGSPDDVEKGLTGNTMIIGQPTATYEQVMPNLDAVSSGMVVLYCRYVDDVRHARALYVDREPYRRCLQLRRAVCPAFANVLADETAIANLPTGGVPDDIVNGAVFLPEATHIKTTMHGPASRSNPCTSAAADDGSDVHSDDDAAPTPKEGEPDPSQLAGATPASEPDWLCLPCATATPGIDAGLLLRIEADGQKCKQCGAQPQGLFTLPQMQTQVPQVSRDLLNECETIIGIDQANDPEPMKLFSAMQTKMQLMNAEVAKVVNAAAIEDEAERVVRETASKEQATRVAIDLQDIMKRMLRKENKAQLETMVKECQAAEASLTTEHNQPDTASPYEALAVPTSGKPLTIYDPTTYAACWTEYFYGDCAPFLKRRRPVTCQRVFAALPDKEELEYSLPSDDPSQPYQAATRSRFDTPEFYAANADILRRMKLFQTVTAAFSRTGYEQDILEISQTTSKDVIEESLAHHRPRHNNDLMGRSSNPRVQKALQHLLFSTATVPLTDGYKMRLKHTGTAMNFCFGPLTAFTTHNYADNYSPEVALLHGGGVAQPPTQEPVMPTLQQMHRMTAESPRSTSKQFLLMEELSLRHIYGIGRIRLGNFVVRPPVDHHAFEDDFASSGARGVVDYVLAALKVIEAQMRGYAHGHAKTHSVPNGHDEQQRIMERFVSQVAALGDDVDKAKIDELAKAATEAYNDKVMSSACTRQYESDVLPARQLGQIVPPSPFSEKQQRQSRYDGLPELDGRSTRPLVEVSASEPLAHIARENRAAAHGNRLPRHHYTEIPLTGCQLSTVPYYQLPQSFMSPFPLSVEGELLDSGTRQLAGMPWEFKAIPRPYGIEKLDHPILDFSTFQMLNKCQRAKG